MPQTHNTQNISPFSVCVGGSILACCWRSVGTLSW